MIASSPGTIAESAIADTRLFEIKLALQVNRSTKLFENTNFFLPVKLSV